MASDDRPVYSFVLPARNEEANLEAMLERLSAVGRELGAPYEIVWVNDGSIDGTGEVLDALAARDETVRPLHLSRNFGHMAALTAGLETARATGAVICLDSDGQHPPEKIPEMVARWKAGADIVQGIRVGSTDSTPFKRVSSRGFYLLLNVLGDLELPSGAADFRLMDRQAVDALNSLPERERFVRGLVQWIGFRQESVEYEAPPRIGGTTKYSTLGMVGLALNGITSFSIRPLRLSFLLGLVVTLGAVAYALYVLWFFFRGIPLVPGWTSTLFVVLISCGVQLMTLGIASEYLARLYLEQKHRPVYIVREKRPRPGEK